MQRTRRLALAMVPSPIAPRGGVIGLSSIPVGPHCLTAPGLAPLGWGVLVLTVLAWPPQPLIPPATKLSAALLMTPDDDTPADAQAERSEQTRQALDDIQREAESKRAENREMDNLRKQAKRASAARRRAAAPLQAIGGLNPRQSQQFARRMQALQQQRLAAMMMNRQAQAVRRPPALLLARPNVGPVPPPPAPRGPLANPARGLDGRGQTALQTFRWPNGGGFLMQWGLPSP